MLESVTKEFVMLDCICKCPPKKAVHTMHCPAYALKVYKHVSASAIAMQ